MPLNVVSALTRLEIDPWGEAARLAALPKPLAAEALASMIARLPDFQRPQSDNLAVSRRLVELLPEPRQARRLPRQQTGVRGKKYLHAVIVLGCLVLVAALLYALL